MIRYGNFQIRTIRFILPIVTFHIIIFLITYIYTPYELFENNNLFNETDRMGCMIKSYKIYESLCLYIIPFEYNDTCYYVNIDVNILNRDDSRTLIIKELDIKSIIPIFERVYPLGLIIDCKLIDSNIFNNVLIVYHLIEWLLGLEFVLIAILSGGLLIL